MTIKRKLFRFVTSGKYSALDNEATIDHALRLIIINVAYSIASILIFVMGIAEVRMGRFDEGWFFIALGFLIFLNLLLLRTEVPFMAGAFIVTLLYGVACAMLVLTNVSSDGFAGRWIYSYPLISIFSLGIPLGFIPTLGLFGFALIVMLVPGVAEYSYTPLIAMHVSGVYIFITLLSVVYEQVRRYKDAWGGRLSSDLKKESDIAREALIKAEESSRAKSEFLSRMSHEMRTPMNAVLGMTTIARASGGDAAKMEYCLSKINEASVHLLGVINDILDMSKIEAGKFEITPISFELDRMLDRVCQMIQFRIDEKGQCFTVDREGTLPRWIIADEQRLAQVITNLLTNAVKFTPPSGSVTLAVSSRPQDAARGEDTSMRRVLKVSVSDSGIGISPEQQIRLFSSFQQADGSIARKFGGTGLGLAISKNIVEMMGGRIWVDSEEGKGSVFAFEAPVGIVEEQDAPQKESPADEADDSIEGIFAGQRILLAEDVEINREIVTSLLEDTGAAIDYAENGAEAVDKFLRAPSAYRLILMDVQMPEVDGLEAARRIRRIDYPEAKTIPIIAMTANVFREDIENCLNAGMDNHIGKPIDMDDLIRKLKQYMRPMPAGNASENAESVPARPQAYPCPAETQYGNDRARSS
jgi:signal transduction histidine kinase/DNA-binding NarL/FixJ family response regulator